MVTSQRKQKLTNTGKIGKPTCYWQEQSRHALNFQQAGFERAAQEPEHAARDEVHAELAQATEMSTAEMQERMEALENQAVQTWTSSFVTVWDE